MSSAFLVYLQPPLRIVTLGGDDGAGMDWLGWAGLAVVVKVVAIVVPAVPIAVHLALAVPVPS